MKNDQFDAFMIQHKFICESVYIGCANIMSGFGNDLMNVIASAVQQNGKKSIKTGFLVRNVNVICKELNW